MEFIPFRARFFFHNGSRCNVSPVSSQCVRLSHIACCAADTGKWNISINAVVDRLLTTSTLYPCGKPYLAETDSEAVLFSAIVKELESHENVFNPNKNHITFAVTILLIHKYHNLIGILRCLVFGPKSLISWC